MASNLVDPTSDRSASTRPSSSSPPERVRVWDLAVRVFHWALVALVAGSFLTGEEDELVGLHTSIGLAIVGLVVARVVWGFAGTEHARFRAFVRAPRDVLAYARAYVAGRPPHQLGHNPLGGVMVIGLLGLLGAIAATGIATRLGPEFRGPLSPWIGRSLAHGIKEVHEGLAEALPFFIAAHVAGVLASSWLEKQNLVAGMFTGWKRREAGDVEVSVSLSRRLGALAAAVVLGALVALGLASLVPEATAEAAETPAGLLAQYGAEARRASPTFAGFDAARGERLYATEHGEKRTSCATCHTPDPRAEGRSPAGKVIEPLAPKVNAERFTDRAKADKWFDRNCKQVLGRLCTPEEKGDLVTWLLAR